MVLQHRRKVERRIVASDEVRESRLFMSEDTHSSYEGIPELAEGKLVPLETRQMWNARREGNVLAPKQCCG